MGGEIIQKSSKSSLVSVKSDADFFPKLLLGFSSFILTLKENKLKKMR